MLRSWGVMEKGGSVGRALRLACIGALLFTLASIASLFVASQASGLSSLWLANGLVLGLLIAHGETRRDRIAIVSGAVLGEFLLAGVLHQSLLRVCAFTVANLTEVLGTAALVTLFGGIRGAFERVRDVVIFVAACVMVPLVSAWIGAVMVHHDHGTSIAEAWLNWYGTASLSLMVMAPAVIVITRFFRDLEPQQLAAPRLTEAAAVLGAVAATAIIIFYGPHLPLLFVALPLMLLATFRLRQFGAVAATIIVAGVSARATIEGHGPIAVHAVGGAQQLLFLQFFVATCFLSSLPVAAALTESDRQREEAHLLADHFKSVVENIDEAIFRIDRAGRWTYLNPAWEVLSGYSVSESVGGHWVDHLDSSERDEVRAWAAPILDGEVDATRRLLRFRTRADGVRWMELSIQALRDMHGHVVGMTGMLRDVDDRKKLEEHVMSAKKRAEQQAREAALLASTDELTALANRRAFFRHLDRQVQAANDFGWPLAVAIFDVDHFKLVNDEHGHTVGDRVLQLVASRSVAVVRSGDLVGRLGGEEFGILMPGASAEDATAVAERLRLAIEGPVPAAGDGGSEALPTVTVSVGIAAHVRGQSSGDLLTGADRALYAAKSAGRNRVRLAA